MSGKKLHWKTIRPSFVLPQLRKLSLRGRIALGAPALILVAAGIAVVASVAAQGDPQLSADTQNIVVPDCALVVPDDPLTAKGLATPYELTAAKGRCHEANPLQSAFVQATILDPATGKLSVYDPLVIDQGTKPAIRPTTPTLPAGAVVGIWFGFNGTNLTLRGGVRPGACVNGDGRSLFGQFAYCNAPAFFAAANQAIAAKRLVIPPLGTSRDHHTCPSTRDFGLVDQDQSDNVTTEYLTSKDGLISQDTPANRKQLGARTALVNGSDNLLLTAFEDPAIGCSRFTAPDLADGRRATSLALDELQAAAHQAAPIALVPVIDPMVLKDGRTSIAKTNLYRAGVDMAPINPATETPLEYCRNMTTVGLQRTQLDKRLTQHGRSPDPAAATNLFAFLAQRLSQSFQTLGCGTMLHRPNPIHLVTDKAGVVVDATFTT